MSKVFNRGILATKFETQEKGSGTDSSSAVTINKSSGTITSSEETLAASTTDAIVVTCDKCLATSIVLAMADGGGAGDVVVAKITPADGSFTVTTLNADPANACDAVYKVRYVIM